MKKIINLLVISIFVFTANGQKKSKALDSESAIFSYLKKSNKDLSKEDVCIDECMQLNNLFIAGFFAHDRGCGGPIYFFQGKEIELNQKNIKAIVKASGFEKDKSATIQNYHMEVINHYQHVLKTSDEDFESAKITFTPPSTEIEDDKIISTMWVQEPVGMIPQSAYHLSTVVFDMNGRFIEHTESKHFVVKI